jgi:non-specific serine/threonine protein kinase
MAGDVAGAADLERETLRDEPPPGRPGQQETVNVLIALAQRRLGTGHREDSLEPFDEGIDLCRREGDEWNLSFLLCSRGARLADLGRLQEALATECEALRLARGGFNSWTVVHALEVTAQVYVLLGEGTHAAVLFGALTSLWPDLGGALMRSDSPHHAALERQAKEALGQDAFDHAFDRGRRMSVEAAVDFVLDEQELDAADAPELVEARPVLTRRELEVAELVARGLSNKQIAEALVLSPRTAEGHVARLLDKLGFDSRARVAAWVAERRAGGQ